MVQRENSNPLTRNPELQGSLARSMAASIASLQWRSCICASASAPPQQTDNPPARLTVSSVPKAEVKWPAQLVHIGRRARVTPPPLERAFSLGADLIQMPTSAGFVHGTPQIRQF